jgi:hypothetical protein
MSYHFFKRKLLSGFVVVLMLVVSCVYSTMFLHFNGAPGRVLGKGGLPIAVSCAAVVICFTLLVMSSLNKASLLKLSTFFQPWLVCYHSIILVTALIAIHHRDHVTVVMTAGFFPLMLVAPLLDACPEFARSNLTRCFFLVYCLCLCSVVASTLLSNNYDEIFLHLLGTKPYPVSAAILSASVTLLPFAMKNLVVTIWRPGSLVILNSKLVSCKMDKAVFEVPTMKPSAESQQALTPLRRATRGLVLCFV